MDYDIRDKTDKIHNKIYKTRLNPNKEYDYTFIPIKDIRPNIDAKIIELLNDGKKVTGGYFCTAVRGFHEYYLMYK